jgi:hypothetical protein
MSTSTFIDRVRIAASPFSPEAWDDPGRLLTTELDRAKEFEDIWLAPVTVKGYREADFAALPAADRDRLRSAVRAFQQVAAGIPAGAGATDEQVSAGLAAFAALFGILRPFLVDAEGLAVRRAIWAACQEYRDLVLAFDFELMDDWTGEPSVQVHLFLGDAVDVEARDTQLRLYEVRESIRREFAAAGIRRHVYGGVWVRGEVPAVMAREPA